MQTKGKTMQAVSVSRNKASTGDKSGAPQWKRKALTSAIALTFAGMVSVPAWSATCPASITSAITGAQPGCDTDGLTSLTISSAGSVSAAVSTNTALATGIYVSGPLISPSTLSNSGTISATATGSSATAYGVYVDGDLAGSLTNSGSINAAANATSSGSDAYAYGIYVNGSLTGSLTNSGTITVTATSLASDAYAATGIYINGDLAATGVLNNSGTISATATAYSYASDARGIYINGNLDGSLINSGTIQATALSTSGGYATAYGVLVDGSLSGMLNNSGTISATATNDSEYAKAYGVYVGGDVDAAGVLTNNGKITATATSRGMSSRATAYGVYFGGMNNGTVTNNGSISASASGATWASAYGVYAGSVAASGVINNSGTISATATTTDGNSSNSAYGVYAGNMDGTLNNSGRISGMADMPGNGYSLYLGGGSGTVNNLAGGLLSGNLYTGGTIAVNNAGTIAIPAGAAGWIAGNYTQQTGGVLGIGVMNVTTYGNLGIGGTADLTASNTVKINATPGAVLTAGNVLDNVLYASGGAGSLTLAAGTPVTVVGSPLFTYSGVVDATGGVDITVTSATTLAGVAGASGNASLNGIGGTVSGLAATYPTAGALDPLLVALYATGSAGELNRDLQELTPLVTGAMSLATLDVLHSTQRIVQSRQEANQGLSSGDLFYGDRRVWFKPFGSWADQSSRNSVPGYKADTYGMAFGVDGEISKIARVGAAFTYAKTDVDSNESAARQNADIETYQATVYGSYTLDEVTNLNWQADVGLHQNDGQRHITLLGGGTASSDYDSWSTHLGVGVSRAYKLNPQTTFTPMLRADYSRIRADGYTEKGGPAPLLLNVNAETSDELILAADAKFSQTLNDSTTLFANIGAGYDTMNDSVSLTSALAGGGAAFTTQGIDPSPWIGRGGLGFTMKTGTAVEVTARYDIEARSDFNNQTASIRVNMPF